MITIFLNFVKNIFLDNYLNMTFFEGGHLII